MDRYLNTAAETKLKDIVWTAMNQDYIEKQALKAALKPKTSVRITSLMTSICSSVQTLQAWNRSAKHLRLEASHINLWLSFISTA